MKSTTLLAAIALLGATACTPFMVRAHGWRYFSDPATDRSVVISPQGDYYLNRGSGLRWVAGTQIGI